MIKKHFEGTVQVYNEEFYVDTATGVGLDSILRKIDPLLCKMASRTYLPGFSFEDIKQELACIAIDGIRSYNSDKAVKLSTFLHIHLRNKLISKLRSENKQSNDAFALEDRGSDGTKVRRAREELNFSQCAFMSGDEEATFESSIPSDNGLFIKKVYNDFEAIDFEMSLEKLSDKLDKKTSKIIELVHFDNHSIKDAAKEVGLTGWAASMRLKNLSKRKNFKELFDREKAHPGLERDLFDE